MNASTDEENRVILRSLHTTQGSSFKWIQSKTNYDETLISERLKGLLKQGFVSNGSCDDSACKSCSGGCEGMQMMDLVMYTITKKGEEWLKSQ